MHILHRRQDRVHSVYGPQVARSDHTVRVAVRPSSAGGLGMVRERTGGRATVARSAALGRQHCVRGARVPRVRRVLGQRVALDDTQCHAQHLVTCPGRRGHDVTGPLQRRPGFVCLAAASHHQLLSDVKYTNTYYHRRPSVLYFVHKYVKNPTLPPPPKKKKNKNNEVKGNVI